MKELPFKYISELRLVFHLSEFKDPHDGIDIVICPALWANRSQEKPVERCSWLKLLIASTDHDTRVFVFTYDIANSNDGSVWHHLLALGPQLLDALRQGRPSEYQQRPLFFICHGLGGILLKHAIYLAQRNYQAIYDALSGIIFLGTPHLTSIDDDRWESWQLLLRAFRKDIPKTALHIQEIELLANVCQRFEGINTQIPIISVYETKKTTIREASPFKRLRAPETLQIDESHVATRARYEETIEADSAHPDLQTIDPSTSLFLKLVNYLNLAPSTGQAIVHHRYETLMVGVDLSETAGRMSLAENTGQKTERILAQEAGRRIDSSSTHMGKHVILPCYSLCSNRNRNFFGRDKVLHLIDQTLLPAQSNDDGHDSMSQDENQPPVDLKTFAICGMGGLGKTEIAVEYIHTRKTKFDAIFWINSAGLDKLNASFRDIATKLGILSMDEALNADPVTIRDVVKTWLTDPIRKTNDYSAEQVRHANWLLLFDNADDPDILYDFIPFGGQGSVLITSRCPLTAQINAINIEGIDLPPMATEDAGSFLQKMSQRATSPSSLETCSLIAERLGGLPLAIVQMASIIRSKHLSLAEFQEYYEHDAKRLQEIPVPGLTEHQTLASIWNMESLPKSSMALLQVLSVLDADSIPEDILVKGASKVTLEGYPKDRIAYFDAREDLIKSSLVTRNIEGSFLRVHRLVQDVVRQKLKIRDLRWVFNAAVTLVSDVWPFLKHSTLGDVDRLRKVQYFISHVVAFKTLTEEQTAAKLDPEIAVSALFNEASWHYSIHSTGYIMQDSMALASLSQQVLELKTGDQDDQLRTKLLADAYRFQGITGMFMRDPRAFNCCKKWMKILVERIEMYQEPDDIRTMPVAYNELGKAYVQISDEKEAIKSFSMSCEILEKDTPQDDLPFPFPWMNWALIEAFNHGNGDLADSLLWPVIKRRCEKLGENDTSTLDSGILLSHMGQIRQVQGRLDEAYDFYSRGWELLKIAAGENIKYTIEAGYRLAVAEFDRGRYKVASGLLEKCVDFYGDIPWHKAEASRSAWKLGRTLKAVDETKNKKKIDELLKRAMSLRNELVPDDGRQEHELVDSDWDQLVFFVWR